MIVAPCMFSILLLLKVDAFQLYLKMTAYINSAAFMRIYKCPHCGTPGLFVYHSSYKRNYYYYDNNLKCIVNGDPNDPKGKIIINRYICLACSHTHAFLPDCIVPWSSYSLVLILSVVYDVEINGMSVKDTSIKWGLCERTVRKFRKQFNSERNLHGNISRTAFFDLITHWNRTKTITKKVYSYKGIYITGFSSFCRSWYERHGHCFMQFNHLKMKSGNVKATSRTVAYYRSLDIKIKPGSILSVTYTSNNNLSGSITFHALGAYPWQTLYVSALFYPNPQSIRTKKYPWQ